MTDDVTGTGRLRISLPLSGGEEVGFEISVLCDDSRIEHIEIELTPENLAKALATRWVECAYRIRGVDKLGSKQEYKNEMVTVRDSSHENREAVAQEAIRPFEVDGWYGRVEDALNHHNIVRKDDGSTDYRVHFCRWVPK